MKYMQRKQIQSLSFTILLGLMMILMGRLFLPFSSILLWSAVFYILFSPFYTKILRRMNSSKKFYETKRHLLAGFFALCTVLLMAFIFCFIGSQLLGQGKIFADEAKKFIEVNPHFFSSTETGTTIAALVKNVSLGTVDISAVNIKAEALKFLSSYSDTIASLVRSLLKNVSGFLVSLAFISFSLYFFYIDGSYLANLLVTAIPIDQKNTKQLIHKFKDVTTNLFMGLFLVAFYQSVAAFIIFTIFKINGALLFSVLILFSSFIPIFGCASIWIPLGIGVLITQGLGTGITFIVLCAFFISFMDNFLRPFFLRDRIKIHPLLIFFSILGGIQAFGFNGILLGPVVVILFFTIVDITLKDDASQEHIELNDII